MIRRDSVFLSNHIEYNVIEYSDSDVKLANRYLTRQAIREVYSNDLNELNRLLDAVKVMNRK